MSRGRVLVVDDEGGMVRMVMRVLEPHYEVLSARRPTEALELAAESPPDVAVLDVQMPEMDGFELLSRLKESHPGVDAIFMTGSIHELDERLIRSIREKAFYFVQKPFDREVLLTLVERCFELRRLEAENLLHVTRLEAELEEARRFQQGLLPAERAEVAGLAVHARYRPCDELGGDFYDYAPTRSGGLAFLVADVSGHGVSAAMLTGIVKSAFHGAAGADFEPLAVVRAIASGIRSFAEDRLITVFCGRVSPPAPDGVELEYVNAGHEPALVLAPGAGPVGLGLTGPLITPVFPDAPWERAVRSLVPGQRLLVLTDGVVEAPGDGGRYGDERLHALVAGFRGTTQGLLEAVLDDLREFSRGRPQDDDVTLFVLDNPLRE